MEKVIFASALVHVPRESTCNEWFNISTEFYDI